ncbi:MAG: hypothetical protein K0Q72_4029, partial [Armatimonadetes bacterium]|nr:hypothetical protein [Armatimonadota bacterium]
MKTAITRRLLFAGTLAALLVGSAAGVAPL